MEISGKIVKILPLQTGQGRNGEWRKQEFVIQTEGPYPKNVCLVAWGNLINESSISENTMVKVSFDAESREFNGKWYTDLKAWRIETVGEQVPKEKPQEEIAPESYEPEVTDDLPF